jgi:hypothetical protein
MKLMTSRPGSGFKLAFSKAPLNLILNIGGSFGTVPVSARFGEDGDWATLNLTAGVNTVPLASIGLPDPSKVKYPLVVDVVTQMEGGNGRLELKSIELDSVSGFAKAFELTCYTVLTTSPNLGREADQVQAIEVRL